MNITQLATAPTLVKVTLDQTEITEKYGDSLEFYMYDRQPMDKFLKFAGKDIGPDQYSDLIDSMAPLILDEQGQTVVDGDKTLPWDGLSAAVTKVMERVGK